MCFQRATQNPKQGPRYFFCREYHVNLAKYACLPFNLSLLQSEFILTYTNHVKFPIHV